jgi:hypothetical protein
MSDELEVQEVVEEVQEVEEVEQVVEEQQDEVQEEQAEEVQAEQEEPQDESVPIRDMRRRLRELNKENKELKRKLEPETKEPELGKEPSLEDFDYDEGAFRSAYKDWVKKSIEVEKKKEAEKEREQLAQKSFSEKVNAYNEAKKQYDPDEIEDAELYVQDLLSTVQQSLIVKVLQNPAEFVLRLGKDKDLASELSKITDPIDFAVKLASFESGTKMQPKTTTKPAPEKTLRSSAPNEGTNKRIEDALERARNTGDYDEYFKLKRSLSK